MSPEKENKLYNDFPTLYRDRHLPESKSRMCDGFCCGDGWYDIIYKLSQELDMLFNVRMLDDPTFVYPSAFQVKEKFGTLRFYVDGKVPKNVCNNINAIIQKYEGLSAVTCEACGSTVDVEERRSKGGWVSTLCNVCYKK
jgi:hypothetical protein